MRLVTRQLTASGTSLVVMERYAPECNISVQTTVSGTATYSVQFTNDDVFAAGYSEAAGTWFNYSGASGATATTFLGTTVPVTAIRLNASAVSGALTMVVNQAGIGGL